MHNVRNSLEGSPSKILFFSYLPQAQSVLKDPQTVETEVGEWTTTPTVMSIILKNALYSLVRIPLQPRLHLIARTQ